MKRLLVVMLVCAGCGGQIPSTEYYLLRSDRENLFATETAQITLGNVAVASYLDRRGLATEHAGGAINSARYHRWAEPLRESLREFLANEIAQQAGAAVRPRTYGETEWRRDTERRIDIRIDQLHGTSSGDAVLVAYWALVDPLSRKVVAEHEYSTRAALSTDGYSALVQVEKSLLSQLAEQIATSLKNM